MTWIWLCVVVGVAGATWGIRKRHQDHLTQVVEPWRMHHVHVDSAVTLPALPGLLLGALALAPAVLDGGLPRSVFSMLLSLLGIGLVVGALLRGRDLLPPLQALLPNSVLHSAARPVSWSMRAPKEGETGWFGDESFDAVAVLEGDETLLRSTLGKTERQMLGGFARAGGTIDGGAASLGLQSWWAKDEDVIGAAKRIGTIVELLRGLQPDLVDKAVADSAPEARARAAELALLDPGDQGDRNALQILEGRGVEATRDTLVPVLTRPEPELVRCAIRWLGRIGDRDSVAALRGLEGWEEEVEAAVERIQLRLAKAAERPAARRYRGAGSS